MQLTENQRWIVLNALNVAELEFHELAEEYAKKFDETKDKTCESMANAYKRQ